MPAVSQKQRTLMAIAEHNPKQLYKKNRGLLKMGKKKLHDFASTPTSTLPERAKVKGYQEGGVVSRPSIPQKGFLDGNYGGRGRAATIFGPHSSRGAQRVMPLPKDIPLVQSGAGALSRVATGTAGALASDMVFPNSAGLNPKEESEAIKAKGYQGFCKGGRVRK